MPHKLLLADDSVTIQRVIELTFADEDVQVFAVGDGRQAIEHLEHHRPDIVLADVGMPERDGYEVAAFIKGNKALAEIPVLLLTGAFEPIDEARARAAGCDGVLVKPFEPQMVIGRVKDLLAGRRPAGTWTGSPPAQAAVRQSLQPVSDFGARGTTPAEPPPAPAGSLEDYFDRLDAALATLESAGPAPRAGSAARMEPPAGPGEPHAHRVDLGAELHGWDPDIAGDPARPPAPPALAQAPRPAAPIEPLSPPAHQIRHDAPSTSAPLSGGSPFGAAGSPAGATGALSGTAGTTVAAPHAPDAPVERRDTAALPAPSLAEAFAALLSAEKGQRYAPSTAGPQPAVSEQAIEDVVRRVVTQLAERTVRETVLDVAERVVREEIARIKSQH